MCGIVGFLDTQYKRDILKEMVNIQSHRGMDDSGIWVDKVAEGRYLHLGHNRLSIQDLSPLGHQPFISTCGNYVITFNGEIYNFKVIRQELEELGFSFISHSDTEVILYAYKAWGILAIEKFIGMFSFAIFDKTVKKIYLIRDRAGIKPLYYYHHGDTFLFSSELKSFHKHPLFQKELNQSVLPYYFQLGYIPSPHTIYKNSYKLEAGHFLEYNLGTKRVDLTQYWSIDDCYKQEMIDKDEKEVLADLEDLLEDAIEFRMIADVPIGVFLSGGYDSTLITALLAKEGKNIHSFTIGFENKVYDEASYAKSIADYLGIENTKKYITNKEMLEKLHMLPFIYDEPFGDSSAIPTMILSELAKQDVSVALGGDGGDEIFCGYSKYFFLHRCSSIFNNSFKKRFLQVTLETMSSQSIDRLNHLLPSFIRQTNIRDKYDKFKRAIDAHSKEEMFLNASSSISSFNVKRFLKVPYEEVYFHKFQLDNHKDFLNEMMRIDYKTFMVDDILTKVDRATMSVGLEGREPLLDHRIIEYVARLPLSLKYKNNHPKYLSRQILGKYIPKELTDRPKRGFQVPLQQWLSDDLKDLVDYYLSRQRLDDTIFNIEEILYMKNAFFLGDTSYFQILWYLLIYEMWREKWFS